MYNAQKYCLVRQLTRFWCFCRVVSFITSRGIKPLLSFSLSLSLHSRAPEPDAVIGAGITRITDAPLLSSTDGRSTCWNGYRTGLPPVFSCSLCVCAGLLCWSVSEELIFITPVRQGLIQRSAPDSRLQLHGKDAGAAPDVPVLHLLLPALRAQQGTESSTLHLSLFSLQLSLSLMMMDWLALTLIRVDSCQVTFIVIALYTIQIVPSNKQEITVLMLYTSSIMNSVSAVKQKTIVSAQFSSMNPAHKNMF